MKPTAYAASETEKEEENKPKTEQTKVIASKRGLRKAKAKAREANAYVASM